MSFSSWQDFNKFVHDVKNINRYFYSSLSSEFILNIKNTLLNREIKLTSGKILYRSQTGCEEGQFFEKQGFPINRMKPLRNSGVEGRGNPKGISYLYLSSNENTSLAEQRPHIGQSLSVARFKVSRDLKLVKCYSNSKYYSNIECLLNPPCSQEEIDDAVWSMIHNEFTKPIVNENHSSAYVPTQILTEYFKTE